MGEAHLGARTRQAADRAWRSRATRHLRRGASCRGEPRRSTSARSRAGRGRALRSIRASCQSRSRQPVRRWRRCPAAAPARNDERVGLQRQHLAIGADDLVLVELAPGHAGDEELPDAAAPASAASRWRRPSQALKWPTTLTRRAFGAQTAKVTPSTPSCTSGARRACSKAPRAGLRRRGIRPSRPARTEGIGIVPLPFVRRRARRRRRYGKRPRLPFEPPREEPLGMGPFEFGELLAGLRSSTRTSAASGAKTRTTGVPFASSCMPSTANGLPWWPRTIASIASGAVRDRALFGSCDQSVSSIEDGQQAAERDRHPGGPAGEFVADLVDRLLDQEDVEQRPREAGSWAAPGCPPACRGRRRGSPP